nr:hypothetical protein [Tanacetum cinerariifolium]
MLPLGEHSSRWANLLGEIVREFPMHFGSWRSIPPERKARSLERLGSTQFDLTPHIQSELWPEIRKGISQHLGKIYTDNKSSLKMDYWVKNPDEEAYDVERPANISAEDWDEDPEHLLPSEIGSSATQEYTSLIQTFFDTHTVGDVFLWDEDRRLYEDMLRLHGLGTYTDDQIMAMVRGGKQRGHIPSVGRVWREGARTSLMSPFSHSIRAGVAAEVARPGMMSQAMMRTPTRMRRMWIVRRCYIWSSATSSRRKVSTVALKWLTENRVGPLLSPGNESPASLPRHLSPGKCIPRDMSPEKAGFYPRE